MYNSAAEIAVHLTIRILVSTHATATIEGGPAVCTVAVLDLIVVHGASNNLNTPRSVSVRFQWRIKRGNMELV